MLRFTGIVIGLIAVLFGLPTLAATVQPVATVEPVAGKVSLNRGQGFKEVTGRAQANAGDQVMVNPGGRAKIVYLEGCMVDVRPGAVVGIAGSCKVAMAKPMTAGLEPVVARTRFPWVAAAVWEPHWLWVWLASVSVKMMILRSPSPPGCVEWLTLVVVRSMTGVLNCSDICMARIRKSLASWLSEGSNMGTLAKRA